MSVFSKIKQSRKAAKDHKVQAAEKEKVEVAIPKVQYKHVPTHAAVDALSGAPSSWKHEDRPKIREHHKRRSEMALSRTGSSLSNASMMGSTNSTNMSGLPRISSYSSYNPTWNDRTGDVCYSNEPAERRSKSSRKHSYLDSGIGPSPLASHVQSEENSPVHSSSNSTTSSSDNLPEIQLASRAAGRPQPSTFAEKDIFQRLHTSTTRKLGEAPISQSAPVKPEVVAAAVVTPVVQPKKPRWSIMGKKNTISAT